MPCTGRSRSAVMCDGSVETATDITSDSASKASSTSSSAGSRSVGVNDPKCSTIPRKTSCFSPLLQSSSSWYTRGGSSSTTSVSRCASNEDSTIFSWSGSNGMSSSTEAWAVRGGGAGGAGGLHAAVARTNQHDTGDQEIRRKREERKKKKKNAFLYY